MEGTESERMKKYVRNFKKTTAAFAQAYQDNNKQTALQRSVVKNGITASAENVSAKVNNVPVFSVDVTTGKVSNQNNQVAAGCLPH